MIYWQYCLPTKTTNDYPMNNSMDVKCEKMMKFCMMSFLGERMGGW